MDIEITPRPSDQERAALEAALAQETREGQASPWADELLPRRGETDEP